MSNRQIFLTSLCMGASASLLILKIYQKVIWHRPRMIMTEGLTILGGSVCKQILEYWWYYLLITNFSIFRRQLAASIINGVVVKKWASAANGHVIESRARFFPLRIYFTLLFKLREFVWQANHFEMLMRTNISVFYKGWIKKSNKIITFGQGGGRLFPHAQRVSTSPTHRPVKHKIFKIFNIPIP